ncbi:MAG: GtrA family protein [Spirochaetes bacterium]|nr:GtrA family protein [Spirochaetota bacterium]
MLKSVLVSLVAFAIDFAILVALTEAAGLHYLLSAALSFLVGTTVSWALSVIWVFTEPLGIFYMASKVIAAALIFFWNFGARKLVLFTASGKG